jgi:hypothetical protein
MADRYPKLKDIAVAFAMLNHVPVDRPLESGWRRSLNEVPNFRVKGQTAGIEWTADVYAGSYFVAQVGSRPCESCDNLRSLVTYLARMLQVKI